MPKLPSGKRLAIAGDAILVHNGNWYTCPDEHFWYETPDTKISPPPYNPDSIIIQDFVHAPVPKSREEAMKYIRVLLTDNDGEYYWRGDWLSDYPKPNDLDRADLKAWNGWLRTKAVAKFIDYVITVCADQAVQNKRNTGMALFRCLSEPATPSKKKYPLLEKCKISDRLIDGHKQMKRGKSKLFKNTTAIIMIPQHRLKQTKNELPTKDDDDDDDDLFDIFETIQEKGDLVLSRDWDSGGQGAGAGQEAVYWYDNKFWMLSDDFGNDGPRDDLNELVKEYDLLTVTEATTEIYCPHLAAKNIAGLLKWGEKPIEGFELTINGATWYFSDSGVFKKKGKSRQGSHYILPDESSDWRD